MAIRAWHQSFTVLQELRQGFRRARLILEFTRAQEGRREEQELWEFSAGR